jgi:hypothetical protein
MMVGVALGIYKDLDSLEGDHQLKDFTIKLIPSR